MHDVSIETTINILNRLKEENEVKTDEVRDVSVK